MLIWSLLNPGRWWMKSKTFKCDFLKNEFYDFLKNTPPTGVYVLSSISKTWHNFSTGFFPMYRGILELKNNISFLCKNV